MKIKNICIYIFLVIVFSGCEKIPIDSKFLTKPGEYASDNEYNKNDSTIIVKSKFDTLSFRQDDKLFDNIGKCIAGINSNSEQLNNIEQDSYWKNHKQQSDKIWTDIKKSRLNKMSDWFKQEFAGKVKDSITLFYPFSGPDFMHSYTFFPNSHVYIFAAIEDVGDVPQLNKWNKSEVLGYIKNLQYSLRNIYEQSYFITLNMIKDFTKNKVDGIIPILMLFINRLNNEIVDINKVYLNTEGFLDRKNSQGSIPGVKIIFKPNGSNEIKYLYYFKCDISNRGLNKTPQYLQFVKSFGDFNSYVKSASYLMHTGDFASIRDFVLSNTKSLLQDDTGVPYRLIDKSKWSVYLYGKYARPLNVFRLNEEKELAAAYSKNKVKSLPFNLGYHWHNNMQSQMMYIRN